MISGAYRSTYRMNDDLCTTFNEVRATFFSIGSLIVIGMAVYTFLYAVL